jgi:hypothetical protein
MKTLIQKIVSGGQTGANRAALDWAIETGVPHGGGARRVGWPRTGRFRPTMTSQRQLRPANRMEFPGVKGIGSWRLGKNVLRGALLEH